MAMNKIRSNNMRPKTVGEGNQDGSVRIITEFGAQWEVEGKILYNNIGTF